MSGILLAEPEPVAVIDRPERVPAGLYTVRGVPTKGTRRPIGTATRIRFTNNPNWFEGSALYKLDPPVQLFEYGTMTETAYVIVANLPAGEKHDELTTVIAASGHGTLFGRYYDTGDAAGAEIGPRLVGKHDHKRVLSALQGGYLVDTTATMKRGKHNKSRKLHKRKR